MSFALNEDNIGGREDDRDATARGKYDLLEQVRGYQFAIRCLCPFLDPYETAVLLQIVDRINGWQKLEAHINAEKLFNGDRMYGGIARVMHRSRMMKALRSLEARGVIRRRPQSNGSPVKIYMVNFHVDLAALEASAPKLRAPRPIPEREKRSPSETTPVQMVHHKVSSGDGAVSHQDPRERYEEKSNIEDNQENRQPKLSASAARSPSKIKIRKIVRPAQARSGPRYEINPRPRRRPPT